MRLTYAPIVIPSAAAVAAAAWLSMADWSGLRPNLLPALSVIAAGVLVRLARGVPFTNPDHFTVEEARQIGAAFVQVARSLRALIYATLVTMLWLAISPTIAEKIAAVATKPNWGISIDAALSAIVGFLITYVVIRMVEVVQGDVSLAVTQRSLLEKAVERKAAATFENSRSQNAESSIAGQSGFGKPLQ